MMRYLTILLAVLVLAFGAAAQESSINQVQAASGLGGAPQSGSVSLSNDGTATNAASNVTSVGSIVPTATPATGTAPTVSAGFVSPMSMVGPSPEPAAPQGAVAVYETYSWQLAANYTFFRFYEVPHVQENANGVIFTGAYYFKDWFAGEGEIMGTWAHQQGFESHFVFAGGGPRFRWSLPRDLELFGHALVGGAHFTPQTSFGNRNAFGYVLGGGLDVNAHHRRIAYRIGADMVGTTFFSTDQFSPRVYVGFVFKF